MSSRSIPRRALARNPAAPAGYLPALIVLVALLSAGMLQPAAFLTVVSALAGLIETAELRSRGNEPKISLRLEDCTISVLELPVR